MRILLVEDDPSQVEYVTRKLNSLYQAQPTVAKSRNAAMAQLERHTFDFVILDIRIPRQDDEMDADASHGVVIHNSIRERWPGTPVLVCSAQTDIEIVTGVLADSDKCDFVGDGTLKHITQYFQKDKLSSFWDEIARINTGLTVLQRIQVSSALGQQIVSSEDKRTLRLFARSHNGASIKIKPLGGLSSARTVCVELMDPTHSPCCWAVAKLDTTDRLRKEDQAFCQHVNPFLGVGAFPQKIEFVRHGAGCRGGLFYRLADGFSEGLFTVLRTNPNRAADLIPRIRSAEQPWLTAASGGNQDVRTVRSLLLPDTVFDGLRGSIPFSTTRVEELRINVRASRQHADLHPGNILISADNKPILIDFASVCIAPSALDPLTLELSLLFHPDANTLSKSWPSQTQCEQFFDVDFYLQDCPYPGFVKACRSWAFDVAAGESEVYAVVYSYCLRQLRYKDTQHDRALRIASTAKEKLLALD